MESSAQNNKIDSTQSRSSSSINAILQIDDLKNHIELDNILRSISINLSFDYYHYTGYFISDRSNHTIEVISNCPAQFQEKYTFLDFQEINPIIHYSNIRLTPVIWCDLMNLSPEHHQFMLEVQALGLGNGVSFPIHGRNGDLGILSFACTIDRRDTLEVIHHSLAYGALCATLLHDAMRRIIAKSHANLHRALTQRELECLRWVAKGKSNWEISVILGISVHGVVHHVRNFMSKFNVSSRHDAVARAAACGLI